MIDVYISPYHDGYLNVAIERYLFSTAKDDLILFLWQNNPCVVFGRNQNIYNEVNIKYAKEHKIDLIRRFSGGGSVYQDLGNLNYTFILKDESKIPEINKFLIEVFNNLGLEVYFSGRNDLLINNRKFSGIAYCYDFDHVMYHGTCLIDADFSRLTDVLTPHDYKLKTHSVASYATRVINLKEIKNISNEDVIHAFTKTLDKIGDVRIKSFFKINDDINEIYSKLKDSNYIYNDCPSYSYSFDLRIKNSNYQFELNYTNGIIENVNIYCDDLDVDKKDFYYKNLIGHDIPIEKIQDYILNLK